MSSRDARLTTVGAGEKQAAGPAPPRLRWAVDPSTLRRTVGDVYDSLLVLGATQKELTLWLPHRSGQPVPSRTASAPADPHAGPGALTLERCRVPTLAFSPADAVDLLTQTPSGAPGGVVGGASLRYWSRAAALVLELLAQQRFVPAVCEAGSGRYRGYWRIVVEDRETVDRLRKLIASMPPVCRAVAAGPGPVEASALLETFLQEAVDHLVRRCLSGDDLAHAMHERSRKSDTPLMRWLRALVPTESELSGTVEECRTVHETVTPWLAKLEPQRTERTHRTCFRLHPPLASADARSGPSDRSWTLTIHMQATRDPRNVLDASRLLEAHHTGLSRILVNPFDGALAQLRADAAAAARHFPPLAPCAQRSGPVACDLTIDEAYTFLRDAAPILELEGFGVWVPEWWHENRPRLRMWLDIRPVGGGAGSPVTERSAPGEDQARLIESQPSTASLGIDALVTYDWRVALGEETLTREEVAALAKTDKALVRMRGQWIEVQSPELRSALNFLRENRKGEMTVSDALRQCYTADDLDTGLPMAGLRAHGWLRYLLGEAEANEVAQGVAPPAGFRGTLRPYQLRGLEWLSFSTRHRLGVCLADDMGLGKTIQLIALLLHERENGPSPGPTLLVVPMSLVGNWEREMARFGPSLKVMVHHGTQRLSGREFLREVAGHDVVLSTYGLAHRDLKHLGAVEWYRVALDEAQSIKNPAAKQAVALRSLRTLHRVALTGTPVENRLTELWSIIDFLNPGYLAGGAEFRRRFAVPIERHRDADRAKRLRHLIRPFVLRRLKSDPNIEADLPEKMEMKVYCNLTREQAGLYQALLDDMLGQIDGADGIQRRGLILAALVKLKQICNHPAHFLADGSSLEHRSGKCNRLTEMLEEVLAEGDRALIFTQFRRMGALLQRFLQEWLGVSVLFLHGGTTRKHRDGIIDRFQSPDGGAPLLLLSLKTGGFGLNLTAANHVFHFDRWWNPAVEDQATDRAHRIGQEKRVQVHKFICIGTMEERIDALLEQKRNLADRVIGAGEEWLTELSTEKLREVFHLSQEAVAED